MKKIYDPWPFPLPGTCCIGKPSFVCPPYFRAPDWHFWPLALACRTENSSLVGVDHFLSASIVFTTLGTNWIYDVSSKKSYHAPVLNYQQVYSVHCKVLCTYLKHWKLQERERERERVKKTTTWLHVLLHLDGSSLMPRSSWTPVLSKVAEEYVVESFLKPAVLANAWCTAVRDSARFQYNTGTNKHAWSTRGLPLLMGMVQLSELSCLPSTRLLTSSTTVHILVQRLISYNLPCGIVDWIVDFLSCRRQRVELSQDCYSEWRAISSGVPQETKLGPW